LGARQAEAPPLAARHSQHARVHTEFPHKPSFFFENPTSAFKFSGLLGGLMSDFRAFSRLRSKNLNTKNKKIANDLRFRGKTVPQNNLTSDG